MPVGATGRFPTTTSPLTSLLAYSYLAMANTPVDTELASTFMRLWNPQSKLVQGLFKQADSYGVEYMDTLGGLQLADRLSKAGSRRKPIRKDTGSCPMALWLSIE